MKTTTVERYEICTLCGGRGQEYNYAPTGMTTTSPMVTCRQCHGSGQRLVERPVTTEQEPPSVQS